MKKAFAASAGTLVLAACVFQACGGDDNNKSDGGKDGNVDMPDTGTGMDTGTAMDTGTMDDTGTGMDGSMMMDSGPNCTNTPCVIGLSVGGRHACALIADGTVRCWGDNARGQLGTQDGGFNAMNHLVPTPVDGLTGIASVTTTNTYNTFGSTCAVAQNGGVLCLGSNGASQLGLSSMMATEDQNPHQTAAQVAGLPMSASASLNTYMGCAVTNGGEYWCWGDNSALGQIGPSLLGRGNMPNGPAIPGKATLLADAGTIKSGSAGSFFNLALTANGTLYSWGNNQFGSLGRMTNQNTDPNPAPVGTVTNVTQMSAGESHACAVTNQGQVFCWGSNDFGELGRGLVSQNGSNTPVAVALPGNKNAQQVSCSNGHTCVLATDGSVYCWGHNNAGQVGPNGVPDGGFNPASVTAPQQVTLPAKALAVGTGGHNGVNNGSGYSCALLDGGSVYCWGINGDGELGRSADAGGTLNCQGVFTSCSPVPAPVVWQ